ncbi:ATP-binding cassette domain-containing protein [bacterium]|nr:ATP-binding cassette domain-containing protein [bacterium]
MSLLSLQDASFDYGREPILAGVDLALHAGNRYALVGPNGAGKTTLLGVLAGEITLQGGQRQLTGGVEMRYLRQESEIGGAGAMDRPLREVVRETAFAAELALEAELAEVNAALAADHDQPDLVARQGRLQTEFERLDGYDLDTRLSTALSGVGLSRRLWQQPVASLSGGERRRAALAAVLLGRAGLLLLDEPTNHLDLDSCEWLEGFLAGWSGTAVIISHDRWFLDRVASRTLHLERGRLTEYAGNYSAYERASGERRKQELAAWQRQQDHIRQTEAFIRKNIEGQKTKQAQARRKQLEKLDRVERPLAELTGFRFDLRPARASGGTVLEAEGLAKRFGDHALLEGLDLHVARGDRIGIIGPNGCGKTTLLRILAGLEAPDRGRVVRGHNVDLGVYDQNLALVSDHNTVLGEMQAVDPAATLGDLRSFLGAFAFGEDLVDRPVADLSGGERGRLALLRLIKEGHNTLLLDEPTNHLDVRSRASLEQALLAFDGTLVMVSHDRRFLDRLVERLVVFPGTDRAATGVEVFLGTYGDWVRRRSEGTGPQVTASSRDGDGPARAGATAATGTPRADRPALSKNEQARRRAWIAEAEETITALEAERDAAIAEMSSADCSHARRRELATRCTEIEAELAATMKRWEGWLAELEEAESR